MYLIRYVLVLVSCVLSFQLSAQLVTNLSDNKLIALVDQWPVPTKSFEIYYSYHANLKQEITKDSLLASIIDDRLISQYALANIGKELINDETAVGYKSDIAQRDFFINILRSQFDKQISKTISASSKGSLNSFVISPFLMTKDQLSPYLSSDTAEKRKQTFLLAYKLNNQQIEKAKITTLLTYKFPNMSEEKITLWDIYKITNIQERIAIHQLDLEKIQVLLQRLMTTQYTLYWVANYSGMASDEISTINDFIYQNQIAGQYYRYSGSKAGIHQDNPKLKTVSEQVTKEEISTYFHKHQQDFTTIIKVKARHIRLGSQTQADQVYSALKGGLSFSNAIDQYSIAADKNDPVPGSLGWILREDKYKGWLKSIPFTQKEQQFSPPFMSPINMGKKRFWEIVYVDERIDGFYTENSETVRYKASRHIAEIKIANLASSLRSRLKKQALISLNKQYTNIIDNSSQAGVMDIFHREHSHDNTGKDDHDDIDSH